MLIEFEAGGGDIFISSDWLFPLMVFRSPINILYIAPKDAFGDAVHAALVGHVRVFRAEFLHSADEAWKFLKENGPFSIRPMFILLDLGLEDMNGLEFLGKIRRTKDLKGLPVTVLSSEKRKDWIREGAKLYVSGFIVKPDTEEGFADMTNRLLNYLELL